MEKKYLPSTCYNGNFKKLDLWEKKIEITGRQNNKTIRYLLRPFLYKLPWFGFCMNTLFGFLFSSLSRLLTIPYCTLPFPNSLLWSILNGRVYGKNFWVVFIAPLYSAQLLKNVYFNNQVKEDVIISCLTSFVLFSLQLVQLLYI